MPLVTPALCHAARALVRIDQPTLAQKAGVPVDVVKDFESGITMPAADILARLEQALELFGAVFIPENDSGVGVRLKFNRVESEGVEGWEAEGGTPGEDDVL